MIHLNNPLVERGAILDLHQLPNGYWAGDLLMRIPGLPDQRFEGNSFDNAGEVLDWARMTIETIVAQQRGDIHHEH